MHLMLNAVSVGWSSTCNVQHSLLRLRYPCLIYSAWLTAAVKEDLDLKLGSSLCRKSV